MPPLPPGAGRGGSGSGSGMRVVNHDRPDELPAVNSSNTRHAHAPRNSSDFNRRMEFRRHADAGRVDYVDLPPLYTDVPRDNALMRGPPALDEGGRGASYGSGASGQSGAASPTSPTSPRTPLLADVDPLATGAGHEGGRRPSPLARDG